MRHKMLIHLPTIFNALGGGQRFVTTNAKEKYHSYKKWGNGGLEMPKKSDVLFQLSQNEAKNSLSVGADKNVEIRR